MFDYMKAALEGVCTIVVAGTIVVALIEVYGR